MGTKDKYIKNKKNYFFDKFEIFQSSGVEFRDNETILKLSGIRKDGADHIEFNFYFKEEDKRWKIDFIKTKEGLP